MSVSTILLMTCSLMSPVLYFKCTNFSAIYVMSIHFVSLNSVYARNMVYLNSKMLSLQVIHAGYEGGDIAEQILTLTRVM